MADVHGIERTTLRVSKGGIGTGRDWQDEGRQRTFMTLVLLSERATVIDVLIIHAYPCSQPVSPPPPPPPFLLFLRCQSVGSGTVDE